LKVVSWNVNGMRACWEKGLKEFLEKTDADIICLQETKLQTKFDELKDSGYLCYYAFSERKGYSGTACLTKMEPKAVTYGIGDNRFDSEGRVIALEYEEFILVNCYVPNSKGSLERFYFRMDWDTAFNEYLGRLQRIKPVIVCGDFNVAYEYIDIYPENLTNEENPSGFLDEEREGLEQLFEIGYTDAFRYLYPEREYAYSWWSNRLHKREENKGWRLDYFLVSEPFPAYITDCGMYSDVLGSDHCPIFLEVEDRC